MFSLVVASEESGHEICKIYWCSPFTHTSYATLASGILWNTLKSLVFSRYTHEPLWSVYTKKVQVTSGVFHDIPRESVAYQLFYTMLKKIPLFNFLWE